MNLFGLDISFRRKTDELVSEPPVAEQAWAQDAMVRYFQTWKYNPDDLVGRKGFTIYRKMMLDEQVKAVVRFKRDAITSRDYYFDVDTDALGDKEAKRRVAICKEIVRRIKGSFTDRMNGIMSSMYQGFSLTEKIFEQFEFEKKTYWGIQNLKLRPFDTFRFYTDGHGNVNRLVQTIAGKELDIDLDRFIHFTHNPEYDEHYGQSELREAYRAWFSKDMDIKFWNMWLERHAGGYRVVRPVNGKTLQSNSTEYADLQTVLTKSVNGPSMILPSNIELDLTFPTNNIAYKEAIEFHDLAIARALLVPNLMGITPSGQTGSYSQSDTQLTTFFWTLDADTARLEQVLNEQLFSELGRLNFGDDYWPRFCFKRLTDAQIKGIADTWANLLDKGGVKSTDTDEAYLREVLDFPEKAEDKTGTNSVNEKQALNGGQISSLVDTIAKVSSGEIPKSTALEIIVSSFPIDRKGAEAILNDVEEGIHKHQQPPAMIPEQPPQNQPPGQPPQTQQTPPDETIRGRGVRITQSVISKSLNRVDFAVINNASMALEKEHSNAVAAALFDAAQEFTKRVDLTDPQQVAKSKFDSKLVARVNKAANTALQDGWKLGLKHASIEIDKAKKTNFSASVDNNRIELISADFFKIKAFKVAGDLTNAAKAQIEQIVINGAKSGRTVAQIEQDIYVAFARNGLLPEDVKGLLQEAIAGQITNPQARVDTAIRTNLFEAINEARYSYFTDPSLDGFVEALEYSAILDSRTTSICQHLDGQIHAVDSDVWDMYRPPNHYNCRSLLIAVTAIDKWTEDSPPTVEPQKGFA